MTQTTRCPACATTFRVSADQLKVAQGWVRCGQCGEVFDASLQLLPDEAAAPFLEPDSAMPAMPAMPATLAPAPEHPTRETRETPVQVLPADRLPDSSPQDLPDPLGRQDPVFAANAYDSRLPASESAELPARKPEAAPVAPQAAESATPAALAEVSPEPAFVSEARRREFWQSPRVRTLLGAVCLVLLAALALQWVLQQRDVLAAQEPRLAPWLQGLCRPFGCQIRPLRRIESLVIENTRFSKTGPDAYRLSFVLRNAGNAAVEIPALQVTLTDSLDQALVRRVVMPAQFGATTVTLAAYSELPGTLSLKVSSAVAPGASSAAPAGFLPVAGYRILAFYP